MSNDAMPNTTAPNLLDQYTASEIMTKSLLAVREDWTIVELAHFLVSNGISGAPVVDNGEQLIGVVSVTDIARHTSMSDDNNSGPERHGYYTNDLDFDLDYGVLDDMNKSAMGECYVKDIMTDTVFDVSPSTSATDVSQAMINNKIHRVFVSDDRKVIGVISALDILAIATKP